MAQKQTVRPQDTAYLNKRTGKIIDAVERASGYHKVKAPLCEWQAVFVQHDNAIIACSVFAQRRQRIAHIRRQDVCLPSRDWTDDQRMFKYTRYGGKALGEILRNVAPQKHVACPLVRTFLQAPATAAVKNLWWGNIFLHLSLVKRDALSDKSDMTWGSHLFHIMLNWALPERYPCCGAIIPTGGPFCVSCWQNLEFLGPPWCRGCATPCEFDRGDDAYCASCIAHPPRHDGIRAAVKYDNFSAQVVLRLKYGGKIGLARVIARQLVRHLPDDHVDLIITPVPLHWTRMWSRTFNQSALIGQELAALSGISIVPDILVRHKRTPTMRGLDVRRRKKAVGGAFAVHPKWQGRVKGLRLILTDDVFTTGATSDGCVSVLKRNGASWVQIFCWARALRATN